MRYRIFEKHQTEEQLFQSEDELMEALSTGGWELQRRAAEEVVEGRARRFRMARASSLRANQQRRAAMTG
jgi:hypothetical protein